MGRRTDTTQPKAATKKPKSLAKRLFTGIFALTLISAVASLGLTFGVNLLWAKVLQHGSQAVVVTSNSMSPEFYATDVLAIQPTKPTDLKVGDVISMNRANGTVVTHRIVKIEPTGADVLITTKGDANNVEDHDVTTGSQVIGKYVGKIPSIGKVLGFAQSLQGRLITVAPAILILVGLEFLHLWNGPKKDENEERLIDASTFIKDQPAGKKGRHRHAAPTKGRGATSADRATRESTGPVDADD